MTISRRLALAMTVVIVVALTSSFVTSVVIRSHEVSAPNQSPVVECLQGQLQVAVEQRGGGGGGAIITTPLGYTFIIVNTSPTACALHGYPRPITLLDSRGVTLEVRVTHVANALYAQPRPRRVVLAPGGVASFAINYLGGVTAAPSVSASCLVTLIDIRLPARASDLFSYEFPVNINVCRAQRTLQVTPVESGATPLT